MGTKDQTETEKFPALFEAVAGLRPDPEQPGFRHIVFEPVIVPALSPVHAAHDAALGRVEAAWVVTDGDHVTYTLQLPPGATGTLQLRPQHRDVTLDGQPLPPAVQR